MRRYFGTDGIRGEANKELTVDVAMRLGYALGHYLNLKQQKKRVPSNKRPKIILGSDTRISGYMLRSALSAGLNAMGVDIDFVGVIPTPAVAYLTRHKKADAGIMISASHNPAKDNGLKVFGPDGYKFPDNIEEQLENLMDDYHTILSKPLPGDKVGKFKYAQDEYYLYREHLLSSISGDFSGLKIILDSANGASYRIARSVFLELGAEIVVINDAPNGTNINVNCGSTHPEILSKVVVGYNADLGLAFDGDADRLIAVDKHGNIVDGDKIIATLALLMKNEGKLKGNKIVTTVMSNMGLEIYLKEHGISLIRANVGDRYVLEQMKKEDAILGGEQSGHIILLDHATTGDGVLTALKLVETLRDSKKALHEIVEPIPTWPQELINVSVAKEKKEHWNEIPAVTDIIARKTKDLSDTGRILVRTSGTENIVRVMVEGKDSDIVHDIATQIADVIAESMK